MFEVEWVQEAVDELAELWMTGDSLERQSLTGSTYSLDQELRTDPFRNSESREGEVRIMFAESLGVLFEVDVDQERVWILHIWKVRSG
jgi:hypothetical protein